VFYKFAAFNVMAKENWSTNKVLDRLKKVHFQNILLYFIFSIIFFKGRVDLVCNGILDFSITRE